MSGEIVIGLDLGLRTGIASGEAGAVPVARSYMLSKPGGGVWPAIWRACHELMNDLLNGSPPVALVCKEAILPLAAMKRLGTSEASVYLPAGLHAIVEERCAWHEVPFRSVNVLQVRTHFLGKKSAGDRDSTKRAVIRRCRVLGYLPRDSHDDDAADALAVWDYAMAYYMRTPPRVLTMFGGPGCD